nr:MAG TPA: hypothetical protein [Caudoviricetes sp.]
MRQTSQTPISTRGRFLGPWGIVEIKPRIGLIV